MQKEQEALLNFVKMHTQKAEISQERCAYLVDYKEEGIPLTVALDKYKREDFIQSPKIDMNSDMCRWLVRQMDTYDTKKEILIGLIFNSHTVLAHVVTIRPD